VKDLIVDKLRRNRRQLTELQRDLSGLDMPSHAPESTLCSEYLATTPDAVLPELNSDIARIDRLLTEYRRALQQGAPSTALARRNTQPRLNDAVERFLTNCDEDLPEARSTG
jgi:hypothetical protein